MEKENKELKNKIAELESQISNNKKSSSSPPPPPPPPVTTGGGNNDELEKDFVAVVTGQGPRANGMPELHKLTPYLGVLQNRGFKVALLTDGRMSGASGKVLPHYTVKPEQDDFPDAGSESSPDI